MQTQFMILEGANTSTELTEEFPISQVVEIGESNQLANIGDNEIFANTVMGIQSSADGEDKLGYVSSETIADIPELISDIMIPEIVPELEVCVE